MRFTEKYYLGNLKDRTLYDFASMFGIGNIENYVKSNDFQLTTEDEQLVTKNYRSLSLTYHPDKNSSPDKNSLEYTEIFKIIQNGYGIIMDNTQRTKYFQDVQALYASQRLSSPSSTLVKKASDLERLYQNELIAKNQLLHTNKLLLSKIAELEKTNSKLVAESPQIALEENKRLQSTIIEKEGKISDLEKSFEVMKTAKDAMFARYDSLYKQLQSSSALNQSKSNTTKRKHEEMETAPSKLRATITQHQERIKKLEPEVSGLKKKVELLEENEQGLLQQKQIAEEKHTQSLLQYKQLADARNTLVDEYNKLKEEYYKLKETPLESTKQNKYTMF
ncbi:DnaJ domain-containing protein [Legionella lytica]|uniref:DnaJ domain-containing protein n=1 Tax=Legionella lytica TaxID=96232 RepID=A0ABW8D941_9GAMM